MIPKGIKMKSSHWILISVLVMSMMLQAAAVLPARSAMLADGATIFVDPEKTVFTSATVGTSFQINVTIANITGLYGLDFKLAYNSTLVTCTSFVENMFTTLTPAGELDNIWQLKKIINNTGGYIWYAFTYQSLERVIAGGYAPFNITVADGFPEGKIVVAILNFTVAAVPPTNMVYTDIFDFDLTVKAATEVPTVIPCDHVNGIYTIYGPPETINHIVVKDSINYTVTTVSNVTVVPGSMIYVQNWTINFNLTGPDGAAGWLNVTIPKNFISLALLTDQWVAKVNGTAVTPVSVSSNATHTSLYFMASLSTVPVTVIGTIPEFTLLMMIPLLATVTLIAIGLRRRRQI